MGSSKANGLDGSQTGQVAVEVIILRTTEPRPIKDDSEDIFVLKQGVDKMTFLRRTLAMVANPISLMFGKKLKTVTTLKACYVK